VGEGILDWDDEKEFFKIRRETIKKIIEEKFPFVEHTKYSPELIFR